MEVTPINQGQKPKSGRDLRTESFEEDSVCFAGLLQDPVTSGASKKTRKECFAGLLQDPVTSGIRRRPGINASLKMTKG
jgi:hypothetical protein